MTNYERIKHMSIEEMTDFLDKSTIEVCDTCAFRDRLCKVDEECHEGILIWLKQDADNGVCQKAEERAD